MQAYLGGGRFEHPDAKQGFGATLQIHEGFQKKGCRQRISIKADNGVVAKL